MVPIPTTCKVLEVPGKGLGLVAEKKLCRGEHILNEPYLLRVDLGPKEHFDLDKDVGDERCAAARLARLAYSALSKSDKIRFGKLVSHGKEGGTAQQLVWSRVVTNGFDDEEAGRMVFRVFPTVARLNHSCIPNAVVGFNEETQLMAVHAISTIEAGCEILIDYLPGKAFRSRTQRCRDLQRHWKFFCRCPHCSPGAQASWIEKSRIEIGRLERALSKDTDGCVTESQMQKRLHILYRCAALLKGLDYQGVQLATTYLLTAKCLEVRGEFLQAHSYAKEAFEVMVLCFGINGSMLGESRTYLSLLQARIDRLATREVAMAMY